MRLWHIDINSVIALALKFFCKAYKYYCYISRGSNLLCFGKESFVNLILALFVCLSICHIYAELLELVICVVKFSWVNNRWACTLETRWLSHFTNNCNLLTCLKRKDWLLILKENHWTFCNLLSNSVMLLRIICMLFFESRLWFNDKLNNIIYSLIKDFFIERTVFYCSNNTLSVESARWWHLKVGTVLQSRNSVYWWAPVGNE